MSVILYGCPNGNFHISDNRIRNSAAAAGLRGMEEGALDECLTELATEARELYLDSAVPVLEAPPSSLQFFREYVSRNKPVLVKNAFSHWPALQRWSPAYLRERVGSVEVTVAVTPDGYADAVKDEHFLLPEERRLTVSHFIDVLEAAPGGQGGHEGERREERGEGRGSTSGVMYIQKQNSNLCEELSALRGDISSISWAEEAFNATPDAINFWMGDERAVTSVHKDHYENIYCVVSGEKRFTLLPPTDQAFLPYEEFAVARYRQNSAGQFEVVSDDAIGRVPWIALDVLQPDLSRSPLYARARPLSVTVREGECLYLPSLWYHHVTQTHATIAVNFWYDMDFDIKYCYYKFVEALCKRRKKKNSLQTTHR